MSNDSGTPNSISGGFPLAVCVIVGAIAGFLSGEPSMGLMIGAAIGIAIALTIWVVDRRRQRG
ncbi:hypothetical protein [Sphingosinithalassobacter portus]|uniref:hypothetical protein n=1 Tax=Stakelama portus TaxID=2676234 RepID=UPI000D6E5897|nr:hypothetical protein [Sphingosinithalassobacter portus]